MSLVDQDQGKKYWF